MKEFTADNGKKIVIRPAPFELAMNLKNAILKEVSSSGIDISNFNLKNLDLETDISGGLLNTIIQSVLYVDSSSVVYENLFTCMERCTYDREKITKDTFEDMSARECYYLIAFEVIKENLLPFFKGLVSGLKTSGLPFLKSDSQK